MKKNIFLFLAVLVFIFSTSVFAEEKNEPKLSARDGIIDAIKGGINLFRSTALLNGSTPWVPSKLDPISKFPSICSSTAFCFGKVLENKVTLANWKKVSSNTYEWSQEDWNSKNARAEMKCVYNNKTGDFVCKDK